MGLILDARGSSQTLWICLGWSLLQLIAMMITPLLGQTCQIPLHQNTHTQVVLHDDEKV